MSRSFDVARFREAFTKYIAGGRFNEKPEYYPRYRSRYEGVLQRFAARAPSEPIDVLDIGGGQLALLCKVLWNDRAMVADVIDKHLGYVKEQGVESACWNLAKDDPPFERKFDAIFFSEVIEHLPIPGYLALARLKKALKPNGLLICTTPNFYRLRNVVYMATGRRIFDHFRLPEEGPNGHLIEYDPKRLQWQFERAGFKDVDIELCQFPHQPNELAHRVMSWVGQPLFLVPRFRDCMVAVARNAPA